MQIGWPMNPGISKRSAPSKAPAFLLQKTRSSSSSKRNSCHQETMESNEKMDGSSLSSEDEEEDDAETSPPNELVVFSHSVSSRSLPNPSLQRRLIDFSKHKQASSSSSSSSLAQSAPCTPTHSRRTLIRSDRSMQRYLEANNIKIGNDDERESARIDMPSFRSIERTALQRANSNDSIEPSDKTENPDERIDFLLKVLPRDQRRGQRSSPYNNGSKKKKKEDHGLLARSPKRSSSRRSSLILKQIQCSLLEECAATNSSPDDTATTTATTTTTTS